MRVFSFLSRQDYSNNNQSSAFGSQQPFFLRRKLQIRPLVSSRHIQVLSGKDIVDTVLAIELIRETGTSLFRIFLLNGGFTQSSAMTFTLRIFWLDASLGELWLLDNVEHHVLVWKDLPFISKSEKVIMNRDTITGQSLASVKVTEKSNRVPKRVCRCVLKVNTDEFLPGRDINLLAGELGTQIDLKSTLVVTVFSLLHDNGKATKSFHW
mmetsp:Transcript_37071/g.90105  ORF Transcript_37071/g.90105 Transcript_37071/m.90105 type:complete len:210 (-) Transcript_37071:159-788(-)